VTLMTRHEETAPPAEGVLPRVASLLHVRSAACTHRGAVVVVMAVSQLLFVLCLSSSSCGGGWPRSNLPAAPPALRSGLCTEVDVCASGSPQVVLSAISWTLEVINSGNELRTGPKTQRK